MSRCVWKLHPYDKTSVCKIAKQRKDDTTSEVAQILRIFTKKERRLSCKKLSVLMLCAFLFTSGSSALLGRPRCGLSMWLSLLAIFNTLFWVYANLFHEKTDKTRKYSKSAIFVWYENGRRWLLGAQSINTERVSIKSPRVWSLLGETDFVLLTRRQTRVRAIERKPS